MKFIFVEISVTLEIILYGVNHGYLHFVFGIEVKQTDCTFQKMFGNISVFCFNPLLCRIF